MIPRILARLENDRYRPEEGRDEQDRRDRWHWNSGVDHAIGVIRAELGRERTEAGLRELIANAPQLPRHWLAEVE